MCVLDRLDDSFDDQVIVDLKENFALWSVCLIYHLDDQPFWSGWLCSNKDIWLVNLAVSQNDRRN